MICALTNDPSLLARYAGVFRGVTALGMMFSFIIDGNGGTYICQLSFQFACYFVGIVFLYIAAIYFITDTNYFKEENVIVPVHVRQELAVQGMDPEAGIEGDGDTQHKKESVSTSAADA